MSLPVTWSAAERAAWAPPEDITVSQWAEKHRVLPKQSAIPGLWNNRLVPYAVGVMDAFNDPMVERITIMASVQSAKTESAYNMLGYAISQDPAPALVVMPTDKTLKRVNKRLQDMIMESPELRKYLTGNPDDLQKRLIMLTTHGNSFCHRREQIRSGERGGPLYPVGRAGSLSPGRTMRKDHPLSGPKPGPPLTGIVRSSNPAPPPFPKVISTLNSSAPINAAIGCLVPTAAVTRSSPFGR